MFGAEKGWRESRTPDYPLREVAGVVYAVDWPPSSPPTSIPAQSYALP